MAHRKTWAIAGAIVLATGAWASYPKELLFAGMGIKAKLTGNAEPCTWAQIYASGAEQSSLAANFARLKAQVAVVAKDEALDIEQVSSPQGLFWVRSQSGVESLAHMLAEHAWMRGTAPEYSVRPGDVVIDTGAHVGVFARSALNWGAAKVLAIESDPVERECLRRNLAEEIVAGKVILAPAVAIDDLVQQYGLAGVDFIKLERAVPPGAAGTLKNSRPKLLLDGYVQVDGYQVHCGPCEPDDSGRFHPHMTYYWQ